MKIGIKSKLLSTYVLAIIIPIVVIILLFSVVNIYISSNLNIKDPISELDNITNYMNLIDENYEYISNYELFYDKVMSDIDDNSRIVIIDKDKNIMFDSSSRDSSITNNKYSNPNTHYAYHEFSVDNVPMIKFSSPLVVKNTVVGSVELILHKFQFTDSDIETVIKTFLGVFLIGIIVLILLIVLFTKVISRGIIIPITKLNIAAESIAKGDLNVSIDYEKDDELGRFCKVFDTMTLKLKKSQDIQAKYENSRKELVASISHDLRTPITSIKGYVEAIQDGVVKDEIKLKEYLDVIKNKTDKLDILIDELFQYSKMELEEMKMDLRNINSRDMLENILSGYYFDFQRENIKFIVKEPIPSVEILVDENFISRVFDNILQNAKKYVDKNGEVIIKSNIEDDYLKIIISDNGKGIHKKDLPNVFNRFYRGDKSRSSEYGGIGLGLSICKQIIEKHSGKIWVESVYGEGTSFHFSIPIIKNKKAPKS